MRLDTIDRMTFGQPWPDLLPGAHNAVDTCLAIQKGEHVALETELDVSDNSLMIRPRQANHTNRDRFDL
jgi:hypothetical protein